MKIYDNRNKKPNILYKDLFMGDCFEDENGDFFVKGMTYGGEANAFNLSKNTAEIFNGTTLCTKRTIHILIDN